MARAALALVVIASAMMTRRADADDHRTRVGVVPAVAINVAAGDVQSIADMFQRDLEAAYLVDAVARLKGTPPASCASDASCLGDLTDRLGVDRLVFVVLTSVGRKVRIDVTIADAEHHVSHVPAKIVELGAEDLDRTLAAFAGTLLPGVPARPAAAPVPAPETPTGVVALRATSIPTGPEPRRHEGWVWISIGAAAVLIVGGAIAGNAASSAYDEYKTTMSPTRYDLLRDRVSRDSTIANAMFIAGGAAAAGGAAMYVLRF